MKKRWIAVLFVISMVAMMTACGNKEDAKADAKADESTSEDSTESVSTKDYDASKYVKLGDYKGIEVAADTVNYTEEDVESQMQDAFEYYVQYNDAYVYTDLDKDTVEEGDHVNIDYVGKLNGEAFENGSATGFNLEIGSNTFIDGFEEGLIGHKVGESLELPLTFPEDYSSEDLAGKAVVFEVKINKIVEQSMPEMDDNMVSQLGLGFNTVEEYKASIESSLQSSCDEQNASSKATAAWDAVYALCEVSDPPQEMVDSIKARIEENAQAYADYYGVEFSDFLSQYMGMTQEQYDQEILTSAQDSAKEKLATSALAKDAGIEISDEDLKAAAETEYSDYGYDSADALLADVGEDDFYDYVLGEKVQDYLVQQVKIKENTPVSILAEQSSDVTQEDDATQE